MQRTFILLTLCLFFMRQDASAQVPVQISKLLATEKIVFIGGRSAYIARSVDNGTTWQDVSAGLSAQFVYDMAMLGDVLIVGTEDGVRVSEDKGSTWRKITFGLPPEEAITGVKAIGTSVLASSSSKGIYRSDDKGATWQQSNQGLPTGTRIPDYCLAVFGSSVCVGTAGFGVFISHDTGKTWLPMNTNLEYVNPMTGKVESDFSISTISAAGTTVYAMTVGRGNRYRWNTVEKRWQLFERGGGAFPWALTSIGGRVILGGIHYLATILLSDDDGLTFYPSPLPNTNQENSVFSLDANETAVFAAAPLAGVFRSLDKGKTWQQVFPQSTATAVRHRLNEGFSIRVQPNPIRNNGHITYSIPQSTHVRISLINALGQTVAILHDATQSAGEHSIAVDTSQYATGVYTVRVEAGTQISQANVVLLP